MKLSKQVPPLTPDQESRFWSRVRKGEGCWIWLLTLDKDGYGRFALTRHDPHRAHRVSYRIARGPIPENQELDHLCRNRACVRPDHLEAVTSYLNTMRGRTKASANAAKTHCSKGHLLVKEYVGKSGLQRKCKECPAVFQCRRVKADPMKALAKQRAWTDNNRDWVNERSRIYLGTKNAHINAVRRARADKQRPDRIKRGPYKPRIGALSGGN